MSDFVFRVETAAERLRDEGFDPKLVTVHPTREREAWELGGWTIKLDPECSPKEWRLE